jgi:26S proteasome non-ATPase regulatory subunit 10
MESRPEITQAATEGNIEKIKLLLSKGANPNLKDEDERIPLHWAASAGRLEAVELFASLSNVAINSQDDAGWTPLMTAASAGHIDVVSFLLSK